MQFTTISGMKMPRAAFRAGNQASIAICRAVTKVDMMRMKAGILTFSGTNPRSSDTAVLLHTSTAIVARPIDRPVMADEVVPRVGHMPSISTKVGFWTIRPLRMIFRYFIVACDRFQKPCAPCSGRR